VAASCTGFTGFETELSLAAIPGEDQIQAARGGPRVQMKTGVSLVES
jgi:hypothetical protein